MSANALDRRIDFDAIATDLTECSTGCPERHRTTHEHCTECGRVIFASSDGHRIVDSDGFECMDCKRPVCALHVVDVLTGDKTCPKASRCQGCALEHRQHEEERDLLVANLVDAASDIEESLRRLYQERDAEKVERAREAFLLVTRRCSEFARGLAIVRVRGAAA